MANKRSKKIPYSGIKVSAFSIEVGSQILTGSIVTNSKIISIGQEIGPEYDLSFDTDANTGKEFDREWKTGF